MKQANRKIVFDFLSYITANLIFTANKDYDKLKSESIFKRI